MNIQRIVTLLFLALFISACADGTDDVETGGDNNSGKPGSKPTTSITPSERYSNNSGGITITLSCSDPDGDCSKIYYSLDGTTPTQASQYEYTSPINLTASTDLNKHHEIQYYSVDAKGNIEATNVKTYTLDRVNPVLTILSTSSEYTVAQQVEFNCIDAVAGCSTIHYSFNATAPRNEFSVIAASATVPVNSTSTLRYYATDRAGNVSDIGEQLYTFVNAIDNVINLAAIPSDNTVELSWTNPTAGFAGVKIFRTTSTYHEDPATGTPIYQGSAETYIDSGLINGTQYNYRVFAYDNLTPINYSAGSDAQAIPVDNLAPAELAAFYAVGQNRQVVLSWVFPVDTDLVGFIIRRGTTGFPVLPTDGELVYESTDTAILNFTNDNLDNNSTYYYSAFTYDEVPNYSAAVEVSASTADTISPAQVTNFLTLARDGAVQLSWKNPTDSDFSRVRIVRSTNSFPSQPDSSSDTLVYEGAGTTINDPNSVINGTQYFYSAFAYDSANNVSTAATSDSVPMAEFLISTSPDAGAVDVPISMTIISGTFTNAIDETSINSNSILVSSPTGGQLAGTVGIENGSEVGLTIADPLLLSANYKATLSSALRDTSGAPVLASPYSWNFRTQDGSWSDSSLELVDIELLQLSFGNYMEPTAMVVDDNGMAIAVWQLRSRGTNGSFQDRVFANRFNVQEGWDPLKTRVLSDINNDTQAAENPKIAMDAAGNAVVIWAQESVIYGTSYTVASDTWASPSSIQENRLVSGSMHRVGMNETGTVVISWEQADVVYAKVFDFNNGDLSNLPAAEQIEWLDSGDIRNMDIVVASNGDSLVVWELYVSGGIDTLEYNIYRAGTGWTRPAAITPNQHPFPSLYADAEQDASLQSLLIDDNDNILVVYSLYQWQSLWSIPFSIADATTSGQSQLISEENPYSQIRNVPGMAMNGSGVAYLVWTQNLFGSLTRTLINKYDPETKTWIGYTPLSSVIGGDKHVTVDETGNALVIYDDQYTVLAYRVTVDSDWKNLDQIPPTVLEPQVGFEPVRNVSVVVDKNGHGAAIWMPRRPYTTKDGEVFYYHVVKGSRFTIHEPSPDLRVVLSNAVSNGVDLSFDYSVTNVGSVDAGAFRVDFWQNPAIYPTVGDTGEVFADISGLAVDASSTGTLSIPLTAVLDAGTMFAYVDSGNTVQEGNEFNNYHDLAWITALPDLEVVVNSVMSNGTETSVSYTVTNNGNWQSGPFSVDIWNELGATPMVGDAGTLSVAHTSLDIGGSVSGTVVVSNTNALTGGTAYAVVDTADSVFETDETNNVSIGFAWVADQNNLSAPVSFDFESATIPATFHTSGDLVWTIDTTTGGNGTLNSIRSGMIIDSQTSCFAVNVVDSSTVNFDYSTDSESFDRLYFYIDGNAQTPYYSGVDPWTSVSFTTSQGAHEYKWCYSKDGSVSTGADAAWVDNISIQ